jgi:uncharacterized membrane protein (UPF0127 family)
MALRISVCILLSTLAAFNVASCSPTEPNALDKLGAVPVTIKQQPFSLWIADNNDERERGLMFITSEQMADLSDGTKRGMLFIFDYEQHLSFWMKNTIIPLDIAYLDAAGVVVATYTMPPLDSRIGQYRSGSPARFAIEVRAGVWSDLGVNVGDVITIPTEALKGTP